LTKTLNVQPDAYRVSAGVKVGKNGRRLTSAGLLNLGMVSVGIGGTVYTMKSACATRTAAATAMMKDVRCMMLAAAIKGATTMYKK
jgi:hypothetical protein